MDSARLDRVRAIFSAFEREELAELAELVGPRFEFHAVTARLLGKEGPYIGSQGIGEYLADVSRAWEELQLTQNSFEERGDHVLVIGRVWGRDTQSITDSPAGWMWKFDGDEPVECHVYQSSEEAHEHFLRAAGREAED